MAIFYRGAGVGTYWYENDPRHEGFTPHRPGAGATTDQLISHITMATTRSPFVSLTRSFGIAKEYALTGMSPATRKKPAFVWEIELQSPLPRGLVLIDPVQEIAGSLPKPEESYTYHHNGAGGVLLGLVDPQQNQVLREPIPVPPGTAADVVAPNLSKELKTLVRALRDAEVLAIGTIPAGCITGPPYEIYS